MKKGRHSKQIKLLRFLKSREGKLVTQDEICDATGWKRSTARTYLGKDLVAGLLVKKEDDKFLVQGASTINEAQFVRATSQSKSKRQFGHQFSPVVRQLLDRSRTNVGLAVETYNRATLENRLDAFVLLFIAGWEQLLKAELENKDPSSIFTGEKTSTGRDKTIGFQQCLDRIFNPKNVVRRNLEVVRSLRDDAAHLLVTEIQPVATRYFQSGLKNYVERFQGFTGEPPLQVVGAGLLTLALPYMRPELVALRAKYGAGAGDEIAALVQALEADADHTSDSKFAIDIRYRLVLSDEAAGASNIHLTKTPPPDGTPGFIVEKPVDAERRYRFFEGELIAELGRRTGRAWTQTEIRAVVFKEKIKQANNEHHHHFRKTNRHAYSEEFVEFLIKKAKADGTYLERARESYLHHLRKSRTKPKPRP